MSRTGTWLTPFIGREAELLRVAELLQGGSRLVAILGPPGVGKTRFADELAETVWRAREGKLASVSADLHRVRDRAELLASVAGALDLSLHEEHEVAASIERIGRVLAARGRVLAVLDNTEGLQADAIEPITAWLGQAPDLRVLMTSRRRLHLPGEAVLELGPLPLPPADVQTVEAVLASPATRLLLERVQAHGGTLELSTAQTPTVSRLLYRLDGLPLALELAAARLGLMSPEQLLERLEHGTSVVPGSPGLLPGLRTALASSWEMLAPAQQAALAQCAVFQGPFDLEAAEAVIALPEDSSTAVLDVLAVLREASLLAVEQTGSGARTFRLLESVRDMAAEQLREASRWAAQLRHARYFSALAYGTFDWWGTREAERRLDTVRIYRQDLLAALETLERSFTRTPSDPPDLRRELAEVACRLATGLGIVLRHDGAGAAGRPAERVRPLAEAANVAGRWLVELLLTQAEALADLGEIEAALEVIARAQSRCEADGLDELLVITLSMASFAARRLGQHARAVSEAHRALELTLRIGFPFGILWARNQVALLAWYRGDLISAMEHWSDVLATCRRHGFATATAALNLGVAFVYAGQPEAGARHLEEALDAARRLGAATKEVVVLNQLASLHLGLGQLERARARAAAALALAERVGFGRGVGGARFIFGLGEAEAGNVAGARTHLHEASMAFGPPERSGAAGGVLGELGLIAWAQGDIPEARRCFQKAAAIADAFHEQARAAIAYAQLGALEATQQRAADARAAFEASAVPAQSVTNPSYRLAVAIYRGARDWLEGERCEAAGDGAGAERHRQALVTCLAESLRPRPPDAAHPWGGPAPAFLWYEVRAALRALWGLLPLRIRRRALAESHDPVGTALLVTGDGDFRGPGGTWTALAQRAQLLDLLKLLLRTRRERPEQALTPDDIRRQLWLGEAMLEQAFTNRLHKTISTLRKLGLGAVLQTESGRYRLDPQVPVVLIEDGTGFGL